MLYVYRCGELQNLLSMYDSGCSGGFTPETRGAAPIRAFGSWNFKLSIQVNDFYLLTS
jgi:hypothetical protein